MIVTLGRQVAEQFYGGDRQTTIVGLLTIEQKNNYRGVNTKKPVMASCYAQSSI